MRKEKIYTYYTSEDLGLKSCPFCGKEPQAIKNYEMAGHGEAIEYLRLGCRKCGVLFTTSNYSLSNEDIQKVVDKWNDFVVYTEALPTEVKLLLREIV